MSKAHPAALTSVRLWRSNLHKPSIGAIKESTEQSPRLYLTGLNISHTLTVSMRPLWFVQLIHRYFQAFGYRRPIDWIIDPQDKDAHRISMLPDLLRTI